MIRDTSQRERDRRALTARSRARARAGGFVGMGLATRPRPSGTVPAFDPATLTLTGWWRASYSGSPWAGTASAGGSGSQSLTEASLSPSVGTAVSGVTPPDFNGTDDRLAGAACSTFFTTTHYSGWALVKVDTIGTDSATHNANEHIATTLGTGQWGIYLRDNGAGTVNVTHRAFGSSVERTVATAFTKSTWQLVQWRADGLTLEIRVNGGAWASAATGTINSLAAALELGRNPNQNEFLDGAILDFGTCQLKLNDATFDDIKSYANARYGLAL